jgi:NADH-quinone oxidoreductase subunit C
MSPDETVMSPDEIGARVVEVLGGEGCTASLSAGGGAFVRATVDVPADRWTEAVAAAREELGCDFFDWLTAVDELPAGFAIVAHLWSTARRHGVLLRTTLSREAPTIASVIGLYAGAAWHERETHEMFGVDFAGHGELKPLLLPPEFEGHPLRKEFVLAARVAKPWPGAKEPGEDGSATGHATRRQPMRPPGVPDPSEWGPGATKPESEA